MFADAPSLLPFMHSSFMVGKWLSIFARLMMPVTMVNCHHLLCILLSFMCLPGGAGVPQLQTCYHAHKLWWAFVGIIYDLYYYHLCACQAARVIPLQTCYHAHKLWWAFVGIICDLYYYHLCACQAARVIPLQTCYHAHMLWWAFVVWFG